MNEYAKKMIQKDPMMYVNANGERPLPQRLMRQNYEERGRYGRVITRIPGTSFDGGFPGMGEQMPGVEEMVARFRGGGMGHTARGYRGMDEQQSDDMAAMASRPAAEVGNTGEMDAEAKAQRENKQLDQRRQEAEDLRAGMEGLGKGMEGLAKGIAYARGEEAAPEQRTGSSNLPKMDMGDGTESRASRFKEAYLAMLLGS